jgi:hypothetical protein
VASPITEGIRVVRLIIEWILRSMSNDRRTPAARAVRADFIAELNKARWIAASPSYKVIEKRSKKLIGHGIAGDLTIEGLPASTVQHVLVGSSRSLPRWRFVAELVVVLRDLAKDEGVDPERLGTVAQWKARHETAAAAMNLAAAGTRTSEALAGQAPLGQDREASTATDVDSIHREVVDLLCRLAPDEETKRRVPTLAQEIMAVDWWREYEDVVPRLFRAYLSLEPAACLIRTYQTHLIPSLLQTSAYAEAVIRQNHPDLLPSQIQRRHALRTRRQQILGQAKPVRLWAIIDETALSPPISPDVMRAQLGHLIDLCARQRVTIQVMPTAPDNHARAGGPVTLLRFPPRELSDVAYLEHPTGRLYPRTLDDLHHYDKLLSRLGIEARPPADSIEHLRHIHDRL